MKNTGGTGSPKRVSTGDLYECLIPFYRDYFAHAEGAESTLVVNWTLVDRSVQEDTVYIVISGNYVNELKQYFTKLYRDAPIHEVPELHYYFENWKELIGPSTDIEYSPKNNTTLIAISSSRRGVTARLKYLEWQRKKNTMTKEEYTRAWNELLIENLPEIGSLLIDDESGGPVGQSH